MGAILRRPGHVTLGDGKTYEVNSLSYHAVLIDDREHWLPEHYTLRDQATLELPEMRTSGPLRYDPR